MTNKTAIVIQARMNSTRFPGKVLASFCGKPLLLFLINRLKSFNLNTDILIATSKETCDDKIDALCKKIGTPCFRGDEKNVFSRYYKIAQINHYKHIIRLTGDNPLPQKNIIETCLKSHLSKDFALTSTREITKNQKITRHAPTGLSVDIINTQNLLSIDQSKLNNFDIEHVIPALYRLFSNINIIKNFSSLTGSYTIDWPKDLKNLELNYKANLN